MIRRLSVARPRARNSSNGSLAPEPVRILAVSDEPEPALDFERNRAALGRIDGVIGAGDLDPSYLAFLGDAFAVPLLYVRGNHDRGGGWVEGTVRLPEPMDGRWHELAGLTVGGLSWPVERDDRAVHDDGAAWRQVAAGYLRWRRRRPDIVVSHVPPLGLGDVADDHYHRGFAAYRWLCHRLKPVLWIHGHTAPASVSQWNVADGPTRVVNVTRAVLIEITPGRFAATDPASERATIDARAR